MSEDYNPKKVEEVVQKYWNDNDSFSTSIDMNSSESYYCLSMFPYPSGKLHIGHVRNYTIGDVISRANRMLGKKVFQPMGWDSFGLPAENAAIKNRIHPEDWTKENIKYMRGQLKRLGFSYNWNHELSTCEPSYYKWEQWFFLKLLEKGLVYRKKSEVNWDPVDKTVLANEQVIDGRGWRSGALVERREIPQWFLRISSYAEELLSSLDELKDWPKSVITMQKNWIGKSEGAVIKFKIKGARDYLEVYTTRPDTICGVSYLALSPNHSFFKSKTSLSKETKNFILKCSKIKVSEETIHQLEKEGIKTEYVAENPVTKEDTPIWIANYVLSDYGTGCVMSVPAHDQRDYEFASKYNLPFIKVIDSEHATEDNAYTGEGKLINSSDFSGLGSCEAKSKIIKFLEKNNLGKSETNYRLRDWGISRQRYWGCPIPVYYHQDGTMHPIPESELPVELPKDIDFSVDGNPLESHPTWKNFQCPHTGQKSIRETDTFDTFFESSWYYLRFLSANNEEKILDDRVNSWLPVDQYVGGIEHAILHLLYARFFHKLMRDMGLVKSSEPFKSLLSQGMILKDGAKMSKSRGNTIDPDDIIKKYGADTLRLFIMFAAPPDNNLEWSDSAIEGSYKFLKRFWKFAYRVNKLKHENDTHDNKSFDNINVKLNKSIDKVTKDIFVRKNFNTAVSTIMELLNEFSRYLNQERPNKDFCIHGLKVMTKLLSPFVPHISQKIWWDCINSENLVDQSWPVSDKDSLIEKETEIVVQINGKVRGRILTKPGTSKDQVNILVKENEKMCKYFDKKEKKIIFIRDKIINYVI